MNDYILCDMISQLSNNPKYNWCILSKDSMAEEISVSRKTIFNIIDEMIKKWFIERDAETKFLRTTQLWYDEFKVYTHSVKITPIVQKLHDDSVKITLDDSVKITPYNNTIYKYKDISSKEDKELALVPEFWKDEINLMQKFLRQAVWVSAFKDTKERWYVTHCYNLMKKIWKDEFQHRLKTILQDEFKAKNANKLQYLYNEIKAFIHSPVIEPEVKKPRVLIF